MSNLKPAKSIADYGGIYAYLDHPDIMPTHNDVGSKGLIRYRSKGAAFCRDLLGVKSTVTIYRYFRLIDEADHAKA